MRTRPMGKLYGEDTDAAGSSMDEHTLAGLEIAMGEEGLPGGES